MIYLLRKLRPFIAYSQTACLEALLGKTCITLNRYDSEARNSLIVSLHVPVTNVDLLTRLKSKVDALIASQIEIPS